jgi:drug/metabolite transporter (DMT)-like permease
LGIYLLKPFRSREAHGLWKRNPKGASLGPNLFDLRLMMVDLLKRSERKWTKQEKGAFLALLAGAAAIGFAPVLVRLSMEEVGPSAAGFFRLLFALPLLWTWMLIEERHRSTQARLAASPGNSPAGARRNWILFAAAGFFFAGDLAFWHWSLKLTSVANATLLTNFAPLFVVIGARILFTERIAPALVIGMGMAFAGGALLMEGSLRLSFSRALGDVLGLITAIFYAGYLLTVKQLRRHYSTGGIMAISGAVTCPLLLLVALVSGDRMMASTVQGWFWLVSLALISHVGGQGLIAFALAHLPAGFASVSLLFQAVVAAFLAWVLLGESLGWLQAAGGLVILAGIALASCFRTSAQATEIPRALMSEKKVFPRQRLD